MFKDFREDFLKILSAKHDPHLTPGNADGEKKKLMQRVCTYE